jgi:hypothetical protein
VEKRAAESRRGQRAFCSDRGQRGGCGKTFAIFFSTVLPRHSLNTVLLWKLLLELLKGSSLKAAWESLRTAFSLAGAYRLVRALKRRLDGVRPRLCRKASPAASRQSDPLLQTVEHLAQVFPQNALDAFQRHFQHPFLA